MALVEMSFIPHISGKPVHFEQKVTYDQVFGVVLGFVQLVLRRVLVVKPLGKTLLFLEPLGSNRMGRRHGPGHALSAPLMLTPVNWWMNAGVFPQNIRSALPL